MSSKGLTDLQPSPKKSIFRTVRNWVIGVIAGILLLLLSAIAIGWFYSDGVKKYLINELNNHLNTQVIVDTKDMHFSVLKSFPFASLDFKNIKVLNAPPAAKKDFLFIADKISFQFNLSDILKKNYSIKQIEINNAKVNITIDENGKDNYHFWKASADTTPSGFSLGLDKIFLKNIQVNYKNDVTGQVISFLVKGNSLTGQFSAKQYTLKSIGSYMIDTVTTKAGSFLQSRYIELATELEIDNVKHFYLIKPSKLRIEDQMVELAGSIKDADSGVALDLKLQGKEMNIQSVLSIIPDQYKTRIKDYNSTGELYFTSVIKGIINNNQLPEIEADFGMKNATIKNWKANITLTDIQLKGFYATGNAAKADRFVLSPFSAKIKNDKVEGNLTITDFDNPSVKGRIKADMDLSELQHFIKLDTIEHISGKIKINADFSAEQRDEKTGLYKQVTTTGDLQIKNTDIYIKNHLLRFLGVNGDFKFNNNDLIVNHFSGKVSSSDFILKGSFKNIVGYMLKDKNNIEVEASLQSKSINLNELLANKETAPAIKDSKYKLKFSENINVNLNSEIEKVKFRKFEATNIKGIVKLKNKKMVIDPVTFSTMDGTMSASGIVDGSDSSKIKVLCFSDVNKINVNRLFDEFEDFGQATVTAKNIKGRASFKIQFSSEISPELTMNLNTLYSKVDLNIENGELNNVEALKSLSRFIDLKELENIQFATLKNQIEIKNQTIHIPKMEIKSSALDLTLSGTHDFNNKINYRIKLALNDLLARKAKKNKKENREFGEVADDGLGRTNLFLLMTGTTDRPIIRYDTRSATQHVKNEVKEERKNLKSILKKEFGLFKKDTSVQVKKNNTPAPSKIKWDGMNKKEEKKELKRAKKEAEDF